MHLSTETTTETLDRLLNAIERELPRAVELRHRLHAHPELAHDERQTSAAVAAELPVACVTVAGTGRIARVGPTDGSPVGVRAELDGLPIQERTGAPFSATGGAMHACGHDVHMAALVALARAAHTLGETLPAPLLAIFQPSEEAYPSGAKLIREELARYVPTAVVAVHVHPELPWGAVALDPGTVNASCDAVEITVSGEPAHGAYPHRGRDPILAIAEIVLALHAQLGRRLDPLHPASLTVGVLEGGSAENVIPEQARARAALRAYRVEDRLALRRMVEEVVQGVAAAHGVRAEIELTPGEPALDNDPAIVTRALELLPAADLVRAPEWRSCGSDDFAFFASPPAPLAPTAPTLPTAPISPIAPISPAAPTSPIAPTVSTAPIVPTSPTSFIAPSAPTTPIAMGFVGLAGAEGFGVRPLHHPELLPPDSAVAAVARVQAVLFLAAGTAR